MAEFLRVRTAEEVFSIIRQIQPLSWEEVQLDEAAGRVLAESFTAPEAVPHFARATMDGYAVRARDTFGASETLPALLLVAGEVYMGRPAGLSVDRGKAVAVPTGGMLPVGADAVVMVEHVVALDETTIEVVKPVAPGENVLWEGEDISLGQVLFPSGWILRPQDLGGLAALGVETVKVHRRPRVAILSTGDEVVPISTKPVPPGKIRDINSTSLVSLVVEEGARVGYRAVLTDSLDVLSSVCRRILFEHDMLILSGGSSVGAKDLTIEVLNCLPEAELLVHGVAVRPGKPTILGRTGGKIFWGLPGQPVSAMMICSAFVLPSLRRLQGISPEEISGGDGNIRTAVLSCRLPSVHGRADYVPVVLSLSEGLPTATPVFGKSAMISTLVQADGYVVVPQHVEGFDRDASVTVHLFSGRHTSGARR